MLLRSRRCSAVLTLLAAGCQSVAVHDLPSNSDPTIELQKTEEQLNAAASGQLDIASPKHFSDAKVAYQDAKKERDDGKDSSKILHNIALARAYLKQASDTAVIEQTVMADVLTARDAAVKAGAPQVDESNFKDLDSRLKSMGEDVEKNDLNNAKKEHGHLAAEYRKSEIKAVKILSLRTAKGLVEQAENEGAKKDAPKTLAIATQSITAAEQFIDGAPENKVGIDQRVKTANDDSQHALDVVRQVKVEKKTRPEEEVLASEARTALMKAQQRALSAKDAALAAERNQVDSLANANNQMKSAQASEQAFQQKFAAASAAFSPSDAEVLRDGDKLVIRLKTLTFPSGQDTIPTSDYPVLAKVQTVMKDFGAEAVDVQGHTDSKGGKKLNLKLSEQRANAVKAYLVANNSIAESKITAEGYGDSRPIASNKSADGRSHNRRIDLVLTPTPGQQ